jgi:hypothetical protein
MQNRAISRFLYALSLSLFVTAGAIGIAEAAIAPPANPGLWCSFYTVANNPKVYCGGVCPFAGDSCSLNVTIVNGVNVGTCMCIPNPFPVQPD